MIFAIPDFRAVISISFPIALIEMISVSNVLQFTSLLLEEPSDIYTFALTASVVPTRSSIELFESVM